jgi:hypothetical protein
VQSGFLVVGFTLTFRPYTVADGGSSGDRVLELGHSPRVRIDWLKAN